MNSFRLSTIGSAKKFSSLDELMSDHVSPKLDIDIELDIKMQSSGILPIFKNFTTEGRDREEETVSSVSLSSKEAEDIENIILKKEIIAAYLKAYADLLKNDSAAVLLSVGSEDKFEGRTRPIVNFYGMGWRRNKPNLFWLEGPVIFKRRKTVDLDKLICSCLSRWTKTGNTGFMSIIDSFIETLYDIDIVYTYAISNDKRKL